METSRSIVDYAEQDNATGLRDALYAAISDRVLAHIETHKVEVAKSLMNIPQEATTETEHV